MSALQRRADNANSSRGFNKLRLGSRHETFSWLQRWDRRFVIRSSRADEGMWLFNQPPREILRERYQFEPTDAWLEHLQKSSVRIGASGSFISEDGLLISNHHVGGGSLQKLSTKEKNYLRDGFYARTPAEELKCLDLEINVLQSIEDVSTRVNAAIPKDADAETAFAARRKVIAEIEKESLDKTGLHSDVVTLWQGGTYHLYRYKRYTDVRVVFAPEQQIAFFGGDPDNFEYPRYDFDICIFRAYENGQPAKTKDFLKFSPTGPRDGELIFVSGHPGSTSRLLTMAELENLRDLGLPLRLAALKRDEVLLGNWSARAEENARRAKESFFSIQNSRKALDGRLAGLLDPQLMGQKQKGGDGFQSATYRQDRICRRAGCLRSNCLRHENTFSAIDALFAAGTRGWLRLREFSLRAHVAPRRRGTPQTERRPTARIFRGQSRLARTGFVFHAADLHGFGNSDADGFTHVFCDAIGQ